MISENLRIQREIHKRLIGLGIIDTSFNVIIGGGGGGANLAYNSTTRTVTSDSGTDAILTLANATDAGLMAPSDFDKIAFLSISQSVDLDALEIAVSDNSAKVSNATHSGDATGANSLTVVGINGVTLSSLGTGLLKLTGGVPSLAVNADIPTMTATVGGAVPTPPNNTTSFLRGDGTFAIPPVGGDALTSNPLSQFASTTSAQLAGVISDETGNGALVFANSPSLVTPSLGAATASSINGVTLVSGSLNGSVTGSNTGDQDLSGLLVKSSNLSDVTNTTTARTNLGLGSLATQSGTFSGTSSGTNTGDQTSIVGISGTKSEFNTAVTDGDVLFTNDITGTPDGTKFLRDDLSWQTVPDELENLDGGTSYSVYGGTTPIDGGTASTF